MPSILLRKHTLPVTSLIPLLRQGHFTAAFVALSALGSEFLVITLSGLPFRPGQLRGEFLLCAIGSLIIIGMILSSVVALNIWRRVKVPHLPRKPSSIAAVMSYVCDSNMCRDFEGLEKSSRRERDMAIVKLDKRYGYGLREWPNGEKRWAIDEMHF
jgi:hypothetical protein